MTQHCSHSFCKFVKRWVLWNPIPPSCPRPRSCLLLLHLLLLRATIVPRPRLGKRLVLPLKIQEAVKEAEAVLITTQDTRTTTVLDLQLSILEAAPLGTLATRREDSSIFTSLFLCSRDTLQRCRAQRILVKGLDEAQGLIVLVEEAIRM